MFVPYGHREPFVLAQLESVTVTLEDYINVELCFPKVIITNWTIDPVSAAVTVGVVIYRVIDLGTSDSEENVGKVEQKILDVSGLVVNDFVYPDLSSSVIALDKDSTISHQVTLSNESEDYQSIIQVHISGMYWETLVTSCDYFATS